MVPPQGSPSPAGCRTATSPQDLAAAGDLGLYCVVELDPVHFCWHLRLSCEDISPPFGFGSTTSSAENGCRSSRALNRPADSLFFSSQTPYYFLTAYTTFKCPQLDPKSITPAEPLIISNFTSGMGRVSFFARYCKAII